MRQNPASGEDGTPEELARAELAQETGLRARRLTRLGQLSASHGSSSQYGAHWLAAYTLLLLAERRGDVVVP